MIRDLSCQVAKRSSEQDFFRVRGLGNLRDKQRQIGSRVHYTRPDSSEPAQDVGEGDFFQCWS